MSMARKFGRIYLLLSSCFFFLVGAGSIVPFAQSLKDSAILGVLPVFDQMAVIAGLVPFRLAFKDFRIFDGGSSQPVVWLYLGVVAVGLSLLGIVALALMRRRPQWRYIWFGIVGSAFLMALDNIIFSMSKGFSYLGFTASIHAILLTAALWTQLKISETQSAEPLSIDRASSS